MDRELVIFDAEERSSAAVPAAAAAGGDYADEDEDEASLMARILAAHGPNAMATDESSSSSSSSSSSASTRKRPQSAFSASSSSVLPGAREDSSGVGDGALLRDAMASAQQRALHLLLRRPRVQVEQVPIGLGLERGATHARPQGRMDNTRARRDG